MKKTLMKFAALALAAALTLPALPTAAQAAGIPMSASIRIGLTYGTDAVPGANLLNSTGSGYRLGYYDDSLNFVQLGYTTETGISIVKTQNVWYGPLSNGLSGYTDTQTSSIAVGCYHIQLPSTYTTFEEASAAAAAVSGGFPAWTNGTYTVRMGSYLTSEEANTALTALGVSGATVTGTSSYGVSVVKTGTSTILFQFDGGSSLSLGVMPGLDNSVKTLTWYAKRKYYGGFRYQRINGGNLTVVNVVDREDYINCVISQEMSPSWPVEALKAQAVTARSYAASCTGRHTSSGFDLCATTHCQGLSRRRLCQRQYIPGGPGDVGPVCVVQRLHCGDLLFLLGRRRHRERQERLGRRPALSGWRHGPLGGHGSQQDPRLQLELHLYRR